LFVWGGKRERENKKTMPPKILKFLTANISKQLGEIFLFMLLLRTQLTIRTLDIFVQV
jgi:hypothetical protein